MGALYIVGMMYVLYGCKNPQTIYKTEYKIIKDTLIVNGDTIIRNIEVKQDCPECPECEEKTRFETRLEYKLDKRKLKAIVSMYEDSLIQARKIIASNNNAKVKINRSDKKAEVKIVKTENKSNWYIWFIVGFIASFLVRQVGIMIMKRL
jgi:hypothetical protein